MCRGMLGTVLVGPTVKPSTATYRIYSFPLGRQYRLHFHSHSIKLYSFNYASQELVVKKSPSSCLVSKILSHSTMPAWVTQNTFQNETANTVCHSYSWTLPFIHALGRQHRDLFPAQKTDLWETTSGNVSKLHTCLMASDTWTSSVPMSPTETSWASLPLRNKRKCSMSSIQ